MFSARNCIILIGLFLPLFFLFSICHHSDVVNEVQRGRSETVLDGETEGDADAEILLQLECEGSESCEENQTRVRLIFSHSGRTQQNTSRLSQCYFNSSVSFSATCHCVHNSFPLRV